MHFLIIALTLLLSFPGWSKTPGKTKKVIIKQPSQILPLDEETEKVLRASSLANEVVKDDANQKDFHLKAFNATKKISSVISIPVNERMHFVYDCLFMTEEGFFLKYSDLSKDKLTIARKTVIEIFE